MIIWGIISRVSTFSHFSGYLPFRGFLTLLIAIQKISSSIASRDFQKAIVNHFESFLKKLNLIKSTLKCMWDLKNGSIFH